MAFYIDISENGYKFMHCVDGIEKHGIFIDFSDLATKTAIENRDVNFISSLDAAISKIEIHTALAIMNQFELYYLQGNSWCSLPRLYHFSDLLKFMNQAKLVLSSSLSSEYQLHIAQKIIDSLEGNLEFVAAPEKSPEEKSKAAFQKKKPKLRLKLVMRDGYKCDTCAQDKEDSLCIIKIDKENPSQELDNLTLRCRKCLNAKKIVR